LFLAQEHAMPGPQSPDDDSALSTLDLKRTPLNGSPFDPPDPNNSRLDIGQVLYHLAAGARPEDFHPAVQPLAQGLNIAFQPEPPMGPGLLGSLDDIRAALADMGESVAQDRPPVPASDLDETLPDLRFEPSASVGDSRLTPPNEDENAATDAAATPAQRTVIGPGGRVVPIYPNVKDFVTKNWPAAERLAGQINGATPEQVLTALGSENKYGSDPKASQYGNYGGIHFDPSHGQAGYFPGQTGVFTTKGVYDSKAKKFIHQVQMAAFPQTRASNYRAKS
jgi:hypothetical protein